MPITPTLKKVQSFRGHDGFGFNADLYIDGKKAATVFDDAHGGCYSYTVVDADLFRQFKVHVESLPDEPASWDPNIKIKPDLDSVVYCYVNKYLDEKQFRLWCKTKICFRVAGDKHGTWSTIAGAYTPDYGVKLRAQYERNGKHIEEILNERFFVI